VCLIPLGFTPSSWDGRIDDPKRRMERHRSVDDVGHAHVFHNEGGTQNRPKVYKIQIRPDPLAN